MSWLATQSATVAGDATVGVDTLTGIEQILGGNAGDTFKAGAGVNTLVTGFTLDGSGGADTLDLTTAAGKDYTVDLNVSGGFVSATGIAGTSGLLNIEQVKLLDGTNLIKGSISDNRIEGGSGTDTVRRAFGKYAAIARKVGVDSKVSPIRVTWITRISRTASRSGRTDSTTTPASSAKRAGLVADIAEDTFHLVEHRFAGKAFCWKRLAKHNALTMT